MAACGGLAAALGNIPLLGLIFGPLMGLADLLVSGLLAGNPGAYAGLVILLVLLYGLFRLTKVAALVVALLGFFLLVVCIA